MARRCLTIVTVALAATATGATDAGAVGPPPVVGLTSDPTGVGAPGGTVRYVTRPAGRDTEVLRLGRNDAVLGSTRVRGTFVIPPVASDGSPGGLSADGHILVITRPRSAFPQRPSDFLILNALRLRALAYRHLTGDFSFDAISPDGKLAYLIQYLSGTDTSQYRVRAYHLDTAQLQHAPVVDPRERPDAMRGYPITRASSADGRWAYTLYLGAAGVPWHPFLHALDTVARRAVCVDLPALPTNMNPYDARLHLDGQRLAVLATGSTVSMINLRTFAVRRPNQASQPVGHRPRHDPASLSGALIGAAIFAAFAALFGAGSLARTRKHRSRAPALGEPA